MNTLTKNQKRLLEYLCNKFEESKTCYGENRVNQSFRCTPEIVLPDYYSDYVDMDNKNEVDLDISVLEAQGLVTAKKKYTDYVIVAMVNSKYEEYLQLLGRTGRSSVLDKQAALFEKYEKSSPLLSKICQDQLARIRNHNDNSISAKDLSKAENILRCIKYIEENEREILIRELSIELFSDSKEFEKHYQTKVCSLLLDYEALDDAELCRDDDTKTNVKYDAILAKHNIVKNPTHICFKGRGCIIYRDRHRINLDPSHDIAISSSDIPCIDQIIIYDLNIMTVENLTSYTRLKAHDTFVLFLSGYSNTAKCEFLKKIAASYPERHWFHFGDLDPDGFLILEDLKARTGIAFEPCRMGLSELRTYDSFRKELTAHDRERAEKLLQSPYADTIRYMLDNNCKLEQEIISWKNPVMFPGYQ